MLLNINRNARKVDFMYQQLASGKKIQNPSDNPIIASRALKFRANISDTEQYMRNAAQAKSWMSVTEESFKNMQNLMDSIRERLVQGVTDTLTIEDRDKIVTEMRTFAEQIGGEMNVSYAGRYVFSGYRTDMPPIMIQDDPKARFNITQTLNWTAVNETKAYVKDNPVGQPKIHNITKIDLPYTSANNINNLSVTITGTSPPAFTLVTPPDATQVPPVTLEDRYSPAPDQIFFIEETGELVLGDDVKSYLLGNPNAAITVNYNIEGLKTGDLNPKVYFESEEYLDFGKLSLPAGTSTVNPDIRIFVGPDYLRDEDDNEIILRQGTDFTINNGQVVLLRDLSQPPFNVNFDGTAPYPVFVSKPDPGDPATFVHTGLLTPLTAPTTKTFSMEGQHLKFEFGVNTQVQINSLAKDVFTPTLYAEIMNFTKMIENVTLSSESALLLHYGPMFAAGYPGPPPMPPLTPGTPEYAKALNDRVAAHLSDEKKKFTDYMHDAFSAMLGRFDEHQAAVMREDTALGSRIIRVDLTTERLESNRLSYRALMSDNENIDYLEVIMNMTAMEAVYQASMMAGSRIQQMTLADFIR